MNRGTWTVLALAAALALGLGSAAWAETPADPPAPSAGETPAAPEAESAPVYGMQVWIDEDTGKMRPPTAAEAAEMGAMVQKMFGKKAKPTLVSDKSGMLSVRLDESMMEFAVVRIAPDGSLEKDCVDDAEQALEFIEATAGNAGPEEE